MKFKDFEDFLLDYWSNNDGKGVLDDEQPDAFDEWLQELDVQELVELGDKYVETKHCGSQRPCTVRFMVKEVGDEHVNLFYVR